MTARGLRGIVVLIALCVGIFLQLSVGAGANAQTPADVQYSRVEHANSAATLTVFDYNRPLLLIGALNS